MFADSAEPISAAPANAPEKIKPANKSGSVSTTGSTSAGSGIETPASDSDVTPQPSARLANRSVNAGRAPTGPLRRTH